MTTQTLRLTMLTFTLLAGLHSSVASAQTCNTDIAGYVNYLKQDNLNWVRAYVASNTTWGNVVTYSEIPLKAGAGLLSNWLISSASGKQYFSDKLWPCFTPFCMPVHPFYASATQTITFTATPTGTVVLKPYNGQVTHQFTATCQNTIMRGQVSSLFSATGYVITFRRGKHPAPPK